MANYGAGGFYGAGELYGGNIITPNATASFNGWAVKLNGVMFTTCHTQAEWDELNCEPDAVFDVLTDTPDGLSPPDRRNEDVTYFQRDGVKHFSDWYLPRYVTFVGTFGPLDTEGCVDGDCSTIREQVLEAAAAWERTCCDTELVLYPDCYSPDFTDGTNVYPDGTFDVDVDGWTGVDGAAVARVTTPVHDGAGSLEITWGTDPVPYDDPTTTGQTGLGATLSGLTPGDVYLVSAWLFAETGQPMPVLGVKDSVDEGIVYSDPVTADDTWHVITVNYTVPSSGELIPFVVNGEATVSGDIAYVDDVQAMQYANVNRTKNGPFGLIGRPDKFYYKQRFRNDQIYDFTALFRAVDQRMYVLDECGTPGYTQCVNLNPGTSVCICFPDDICFDPCICFPTLGDPVDPTEVAVGGTQKVYPTITLYGNLQSPRIENVTTGEYITYSGTVGDSPVTINTEDGTAFDSEGNSVTNELDGSLFLSMDPGNYEWQLVSVSDPDDQGYATLCWRDTVVSA